jgi:dolichyl-diphosphooligosaccharide--protein glycosyltransferase
VGSVSTRILLPGALFVLALAMRALPWPTVFSAEGVFFPDPDAYYHLRRVAWSVARFPAVLETDSYINFPYGAKPIWTPVFDWLVALGVRATPAAASEAALERAVAWVPPLLGALCVVALQALARRDFGARVALGAGALLAFLPAHFWYSQLGFLDHHAAVALASALVLGALIAALRSDGLGPALGLGAAVGGALLVWPGCLLETALVAAALLVHLAATRERDLAAARARRFAGAFALAAAVVAPLGLAAEWPRWGNLSPLVLSRFQPLALAAGALWLLALGALWRRAGFPATPTARLAGACSAGLALAAGLLAAAPGLRAGLGDAWAWLARREEFQALVAESEPLLGSARDLGLAGQLLTPLALATPLLAVALVAIARRRGPWPAGPVVAGWCVAFFAASLAQRRFVVQLAAPFALLLAACAAPALGAARRVASRRGPAAALALGLGALAAGAALAAPVAAFYARPLANLRRAARGEAPLVRGWLRTQRGLVPVARWLRSHSPPTAGWLDPAAQPEYGVLAPWGDGHLLRYVARRPMVQDNFGDDVGARNFALAERYFAAESEAEALAILRELRVRYVVVRGAGSGHGAGYGPASLFARLHRLKGSSGSFGAGEGREPLRVPALERHRLLLDTEGRDARAGESRPAYKLFEVVPGARVVGRAAPGALVTARLAVREGAAGRFFWSAEATADAEGRYALTLPYANRGAATDVRPAPSYELRSGDARGALVVEEAAVRDGATLPGPDLVPSSDAARLRGSSAAAARAATATRLIGPPTVSHAGR